MTLLTEIVKDEVVEKPDGVRKALWDYSIDLVGPGERAKAQLAACREAGVPLRLLGMAEETFEASLLPHIPAMDRWGEAGGGFCEQRGRQYLCLSDGPLRRDERGGSKQTSFGGIRHLIGTRSSMILPCGSAVLRQGPHVRTAWRQVSEAIDFSPEIGPYYQGTHYLGPMHPMFADLDAEIPEVFYGYYLFYAEITAADAFKGAGRRFIRMRGGMRQSTSDTFARWRIGWDVPLPRWIVRPHSCPIDAG